ncbi:MAG: hypothetical protein N3G22_05045 [Candidatus Micrarchaeota archaeon]|nr:hypothetical protein [Candidatus Micrarchaeota archaeon]
MSDKSRALIAFAKLVVALAAGALLANIWIEARGYADEWYVPYGAGILVAAVIYLLLTRLSKSSAD